MAGSDVRISGLGPGTVRVTEEMNRLVDDLETLRAELSATIADVSAIHTAVTGITAKLDADAGVSDTDYASTQDPAAQTATAGNVDAAGDLAAGKVNP